MGWGTGSAPSQGWEALKEDETQDQIRWTLGWEGLIPSHFVPGPLGRGGWNRSCPVRDRADRASIAPPLSLSEV